MVQYGLKQSPRAWFDWFNKAMVIFEYKRSNGDHSMFVKTLREEDQNSYSICGRHYYN